MAVQESGQSPVPIEGSAELRSLASDCVHCGFCLPACPTYQLWGEEMDSPRGRIHLITQILDGADGSAAASTHLDRCLGCMACVTACPSGVRYDLLIEAARGWTEDDPERPADGPTLPPRSARERALRAAIFRLFPYPRRLRVAIAPLRAAHQPQRPGGPAASRDRLGAPAGAAAPGGQQTDPRDAARASAGPRHPPRNRRHAHRLRAAGLLSPGQRGHGAGTGGRGLRRHRPGRPGLLRRAVLARRQAG
jgi:glycolate oxidase iron-sulfur subunit